MTGSRPKESKPCPECGGRLYERIDPPSGFTDLLCWACGHYESNSPAFKNHPEMFTNLLRENLNLFYKSPAPKHPFKSPEDEALP